MVMLTKSGRRPRGSRCNSTGSWVEGGRSWSGMSSRMRDHASSSRARVAAKPIALALATGLLLGGCFFSETFQRGYVLPEGALEQIPIGATQEQVLIVLGTPSTVATVSGEAFYYISQRTERAAAFMPQKVVDQRVVAVYFDKNRRVERLANYGLRDGKIFDFVSRTTPTGGEELNYLRSFFRMINQLAP
jgi:outer membrane protein assembly factor BamE (lipoprotein component of BamABCDE complex)